MTQYIDKAALVAEIERRFKTNLIGAHSAFKNGKIEALREVKDFLNTLEVKEEILDKKGKAKLMQKCVHKAYQRGYDMGVLQTTNKINHNTKEVDLEKEMENWIERNQDNSGFYDNIEFAKHFFELGLKVQREISYVPNIDDSLKELGVDTYSTEAKIFKESYCMALEKFKAQKGE